MNLRVFAAKMGLDKTKPIQSKGAFMSEFENKTIIVTGGGRGIGLCITQFFLREGAKVFAMEIDEHNLRTALEFLDLPGAVFIRGNVSNEAAVADLIASAQDRTGRIDFLINNAGLLPSEDPIEQRSWADFRRRIEVNLGGAFLCAKYAASALRQNHGAIVNIASTRALMSEGGTEAYAASKGGLVALTHSLAMSLAPEVRVNCISPGWIVTDAYAPGREPTRLSDEDHAQHPVGRVGRPEDIAHMVLYLCSSKAGFITGQNFIIDGGMTKKMIYVE